MQIIFCNKMQLLRKIYYFIPAEWRYTARRVWYFPHDIWFSINNKNELQPPKGMIFIGSGNFLAQGNRYLKFFIELGGLRPEQHVLDIGCGIGRMAIPLTKYLNQNGSYSGFDIVKKGIDWCNKNISYRHKNFSFKCVNLQNDLYKSDGDNASHFVFPYADNSFDFIILTSVFTHMMPDEIKQYCAEISRVLKSGGTCFATFFVLDDESEKLMDEEKKFYFKHDFAYYKLMDEKVKSANIALKKTFIVDECLKKNNLKLKHHHKGYWCGRSKIEAIDFQDILIIAK
ncbi:MAG: class I SAM-dependent methyltransferase [Bacteroidetes bacterium]|nr:class I SAM-dependent methyltransferase [Bacteroidota bacterium]